MEEQGSLLHGRCFPSRITRGHFGNTSRQLWRCHCRLQAVGGSGAAFCLAAVGQYEPNLVLGDHRNGPAAVPYQPIDEADDNKMPG